MAICFNCGALIPEGAAFCPNCGTPVASAPKAVPPETEEILSQNPAQIPDPQEPPTEQTPPAAEEIHEDLPPFLTKKTPEETPPFPPQENPVEQPSFQPRENPVEPPPFQPRETPFYSQPSAPQTPPPTKSAEGKKKSKLPLILGAAVLLVAVVLGILFLTGVLGGKSASDLDGVWVLAEGGASGFAPGDIVLEIAPEGAGTATVKGAAVSLTWTKDSITINGVTDEMRLDGEDLIIDDSQGALVFRRDEAPAEAPAGSAFGSAFAPAPAETQAEEPAPAEPKPEEPAPAEPKPEEPAPAEPEPEPTVNEDGDGPYWNLPAISYDTGKTFPFGTWGGVYVYNGWFFKTYFQLNEDYTCTRTIYRDGVIVTDEKGVFEYENNKIKLYMNGDRNTWTEYAVSGQMMVNNNHEFFRQDPGGLIGAWVGDYYYNDKHIHTTYILRSDGTYSEVTYRDDEKITDNEGSWTFDGSTLKLKATDTPNLTTPFTYVDDVLINNNYKYWRS